MQIIMLLNKAMINKEATGTWKSFKLLGVCYNTAWDRWRGIGLGSMFQCAAQCDMSTLAGVMLPLSSDISPLLKQWVFPLRGKAQVLTPF